MITGLREAIETYSQNIREKFPDNAAMYESFMQYIEESPKYKNWTPEKSLDVERFFREELTRFDIVGACIDYIEKSNATGETAIRKYLNAMTKLYKDVIKSYHNDTLSKSVPFSKLYDDVRTNVKKDLQQLTPCRPVTLAEAKLIMKHFQHHAKHNNLTNRKEIIIWLTLLYGFKFERIRDMKRRSVNLNRRSVIIEYGNDSIIELPLPIALLSKLDRHMNDSDLKNEYLFTNSNGNQITPAFLNHDFAKMFTYMNSDSQPSMTSLAKFAIMVMIEKKIDFLTIKNITGMEDIIISDCAIRFLQSQNTRDASYDLKGMFQTTDVYKAID